MDTDSLEAWQEEKRDPDDADDAGQGGPPSLGYRPVVGPKPRRGPRFLGCPRPLGPLGPRPLGPGARARHTVVIFETSKNKN